MNLKTLPVTVTTNYQFLHENCENFFNLAIAATHGDIINTLAFSAMIAAQHEKIQEVGMKVVEKFSK